LRPSRPGEVEEARSKTGGETLIRIVCGAADLHNSGPGRYDGFTAERD
jgi:hypothetical protein